MCHSPSIKLRIICIFLTCFTFFLKQIVSVTFIFTFSIKFVDLPNTSACFFSWKKISKRKNKKNHKDFSNQSKENLDTAYFSLLIVIKACCCSICLIANQFIARAKQFRIPCFFIQFFSETTSFFLICLLDIELRPSFNMLPRSNGSYSKMDLNAYDEPIESSADSNLNYNRELVVHSQMKKFEHKYVELKEFRIFIGSWNVNGQTVSTSLGEHWLSCDPHPPDVYAIGFQELDLSKEAFLFK